MMRQSGENIVPEGQIDSSQAIHCLERARKSDPSRRDGVIRFAVTSRDPEP
jgi:hypothetical protein